MFLEFLFRSWFWGKVNYLIFELVILYRVFMLRKIVSIKDGFYKIMMVVFG